MYDGEPRRKRKRKRNRRILETDTTFENFLKCQIQIQAAQRTPSIYARKLHPGKSFSKYRKSKTNLKILKDAKG
jgi:hypothetical protein